MTVEQIVKLLRQDVVPALGCTEPVCVALCAANAAKINEQDVISIDIAVNPGIYKNGMSAGIPSCEHVGLDYAAAIGAFLRNPEKNLTLLEDITPEILNKAENLVNNKSVKVRIAEEEKNLYVKCIVKSRNNEEAVCVIRDAHTNVYSLEKNGQTVYKHESDNIGNSDNNLVNELMKLKISEMRDLVDKLPVKDILFLLDGVEMNDKLAAYSETHKIGVGIADSFRKEISSDRLLTNGLIDRIILKVSSAAESRLDGCPIPTMSSSGAGTKGLVVILPVNEVAKTLGVSKENNVRALALSHLVNRYINAAIGKLSPMCTCVMAASIAASVGITYLLGGTNEQIGHAIRNMSGTVTGMICDGGKVGCALKVSAGSVSAVLSAVTAIHDATLRISDGICAETPEDCIRNMALIGKNGMTNTDKEIIHIMDEKHK